MPRLLYVARHGETDWNVALRWQGHTDVPLNERGRWQARALAAKLRGLGIAGAVASDLSRAHETAHIVATELGVAVAYVDCGLRERRFGPFEGLTRAECEAQHAVAWQAWLAARTVPLGAEGHEELTVRMVAAVARAAVELLPLEAPALVVTHGGAMRALIATATGKLPPLLENGAVWRIVWEGRVVRAEAL
jgi:broad specificity phosphatase PhoE